MAGNALAFELTADTIGFDAAIKKSQGAILSLGNKVSADLKHLVAGVASYEAVKGLVGHTIDAAKEVRNFGKQAGITTDEVQMLQKAAGKVGLEFEDFQTGMSRMGVARREAATSDQKLLNFFNRWGVSLKDLEDPQLKNIDLLKKMSAAMQGVELTSAQRSEFRDVFGRSGERLIAAIEQLDHLGPLKLIEKQDIESIYEMDRALNKLKKTWMAKTAPAVGATAWALTEMFTPGASAEHWEGRAVWNTKEARDKAKKAAAEKNGPLNEIPKEEQWRRYYDFLDKEAELAERVRKINFDMLTPKEKALDLQVRINEELERADELKKKGDIDSLRAAQSHLLNAEQLNEQLLGLNAALKPNIPRADQAAAAGGFIGGAVNFNPSNFQNRELINLTQQVRDNTARIADKITTPANPEGVF